MQYILKCLHFRNSESTQYFLDFFVGDGFPVPRNAEDSVPYRKCKRYKSARRSIRESTLRQGAELNRNNTVKVKCFTLTVRRGLAPAA